MPEEFNPASLPVGQIGMIPGIPTVFQVVNKADALCRISHSYVAAFNAVSGAPIIVASHTLVLISGFDFSLVPNHSHAYITVPCRVVGVYKYQTAVGSTNTVPKIEPLRYLASARAKRSKK